MLSPRSPNSPEAVFAALEEGIYICDQQTDGEVSLSIRQIGGEEFELSVSSLRGSFRCRRAELQRFLEHCPEEEQNSISKYRERFRRGLQHILPNGFGLLKLDFTECRKGRIFPKFSSTITKLCKHDN